MPGTFPSPAPGPSRRSMLGLLGAIPLATTGGLVTARSAHAHTEPSVSAGIPADLQPGGKFDRFVADRAAKGLFSGTLLLAHQGEPVLERSHGMADKERSIPNQAGTIFNLASVTKTFTSVAVAQLVQEGKVAYHEPLGTYLDGFPGDIAKAVTVHHLLTHTSGLGRPPARRQSGPPPEPPEVPASFEEAMAGELAALRKLPLQFAPGTKYTYSNDGFLVLGAIVAAVSGGSFYDYVREHVFAAAGMSRTDYLSGQQVLDNGDVAHPHATQEDGTVVDGTTTPQFEHMSLMGGPAGGAFSTVSDLLAFVRALQDGTLLEPTFVELITTGKVALPPSGQPGPKLENTFYGYGFRTGIVGGQPLFGHSGGSTAGTSNMLDIFPDLDWVAVTLTNHTKLPDSKTWLNPVLELERDLIVQQEA